MGDNGARTSAPAYVRTADWSPFLMAASPSSSSRSRPFPGIALYSTVVCVLAVVAAVVSFVKGGWLVGVVWVLLVGLTSNMAWYYTRRARARRTGGGERTPAQG